MALTLLNIIAEDTILYMDQGCGIVKVMALGLIMCLTACLCVESLA